jgi:predicted DCC family thiol-disulfide oxidoreductase YuxK
LYFYISYLYKYTAFSILCIPVLLLYLLGNFRFASLQSKVGKSLLLSAGKRHDDLSTIVLIEPCSSKGGSDSTTTTTTTQAYFKSDAVLKIAKGLDDPLFSTVGAIGSYIVPKFIRNQIYQFVANNRYRFGEIVNDGSYSSCRLDKYEEFEDRFIMDPTN